MTAAYPMPRARLWFLKPVGKKFPMFTYSCPGRPRAGTRQESGWGQGFFRAQNVQLCELVLSFDGFFGRVLGI